MATLDDKLLGEKLHYYCSSSEDEGQEDEDGEREDRGKKGGGGRPQFVAEENLRERDGSSVNTGPKGVIRDWQRFKQLETEKREEQEMEKVMLMKKLSMTCKTHSEEEKDKQREKEVEEEVEHLLNTSDSFLEEYMRKRMTEMMYQHPGKREKRSFGRLLELESGPQFLEAVDREEADVTVVCHIYSGDTPGCHAMNGCLRCLATNYPFIKFCCIEASSAGMSRHFEKSGVPALLVYKKGHLLGNFVRLTDELGEDFFAGDVEMFLVEHGFLPDQSCVPQIVSSKIRDNANDDDSDCE